MLHQSVTRTETFVPRLSPVILQLIFRSTQRLVSPEIDIILRCMLALESGFNWMSWEKFLALYLALISSLHALAKVESVTVGELYRGAATLNSSVLDVKIPMIPRSVVQCDAFSPTLAASRTHATSVILPKKNNPGFDVAMAFGMNQWLLIEAKYSENNATTTSALEVFRKYSLIEDGQNAFPGMFQFILRGLMGPVGGLMITAL